MVESSNWKSSRFEISIESLDPPPVRTAPKALERGRSATATEVMNERTACFWTMVAMVGVRVSDRSIVYVLLWARRTEKEGGMGVGS